MSSLYFLFPTLIAVFISFLFVRAAGIALMMTGLEKKKQDFRRYLHFLGQGLQQRKQN